MHRMTESPKGAGVAQPPCAAALAQVPLAVRESPRGAWRLGGDPFRSASPSMRVPDDPAALARCLEKLVDVIRERPARMPSEFRDDPGAAPAAVAQPQDRSSSVVQLYGTARRLQNVVIGRALRQTKARCESYACSARRVAYDHASAPPRRRTAEGQLRCLQAGRDRTRASTAPRVCKQVVCQSRTLCCRQQWRPPRDRCSSPPHRERVSVLVHRVSRVSRNHDPMSRRAAPMAMRCRLSLR